MNGNYQYIEVIIDGPMARINMNRPEHHNVIFPEIIMELSHALDEISLMDQLLFVVLSGNGPSFCAGADMKWLAGAGDRSLEQNSAHYEMFAQLLLKLFQIPQVSIACVRGNVFGGGIGLMATCDFVLATPNTRFMFSEVKRGILPAIILPFISKRLPVQYLRKWMLTGDFFDGKQALEAGLVDSLAENDALESALIRLMASFEEASPSAIKKTKKMINLVVCGSVDIKDIDLTSTTLAVALLSPDGQEGIHSFLEKRKPVWQLHSQQRNIPI
ncbi:MAG: enoyl-CoA hydratase-related protein [Methylococcaceae bacterium]|nr:enoyl-CoA hydratase-related protein [Prolixibacteraceae bacterium]